MSASRGLALVTGGGTGIGAACCRELARVGFTVAVHYNSSEASARAIAEELPGAFAIKANLSVAAEIDQLCEEIRSRSIPSVLVNNAGMTIDAPLFTAKLEDFDQMVATNYRSTWYLIKRISRLMIRAKAGRIINISSVVASTGNPGQSAYASTKAAIEGLTRTAAIELAPQGILVNAIAPGLIRTRMMDELPEEKRTELLSRVPMGRLGEPAEIARMVRFLSEEECYATGAVFHLNGGFYCG